MEIFDATRSLITISYCPVGWSTQKNFRGLMGLKSWGIRALLDDTYPPACQIRGEKG